MKNGIFKVLSIIILSSTSIITIASDAYTPNPFTPAPKEVVINNQNTPARMASVERERRTNTINNLNGQINQAVTTVTQVLTEREIRSKKILEQVNGKIANGKNIPIENSRFVGVLNGKRVYQNLETNEYIKITIEK